MSAHLSQPSFQYYGVLNGIMYRIDAESASPSAPLFGAVPVSLQNTVFERMARAPSPVAEAPAVIDMKSPEELAAEQLRAERAAARALLFRRDGAEPLRAGHPDMWALLVNGTSLEGTDFPAP